ncbi:MAG: hypothetical protein H7X80_09065 [bacterium]|nr:hypothetical protein [Candidatus Kapabacteria bacterium]
MNRNSFFSTGLVALALFASACSQSTSPTGPGSNSQIGGNTQGNPGILAKLSEPSAFVDPIDNANYRLVFSAYAVGSSDSEPMRATRAIDKVVFEVHAPSGAIIDSETAREVSLSGIKLQEDQASLSVNADVTWPVSASISRGSYVLAIVHGRNGEVLIRRADLPFESRQ